MFGKNCRSHSRLKKSCNKKSIESLPRISLAGLLCQEVCTFAMLLDAANLLSFLCPHKDVWDLLVTQHCPTLVTLIRLPRWLSGKESACQSRRHQYDPGLGRSPGVGNSNPLQYSCLENPMDRGAWWATLHGVAEPDSVEGLSTHMHTLISHGAYIPENTGLVHWWVFIQCGVHYCPFLKMRNWGLETWPLLTRLTFSIPNLLLLVVKFCTPPAPPKKSTVKYTMVRFLWSF